MADEINPMQGIRWPRRKRQSIGRDIVDLGVDVFNGITAIREEERRLEPVRQLQQSQAELKGALVKIKMASVLAGAMCADTPEKRQTVLNETELLCSMIRGDQLIDVSMDQARQTEAQHILGMGVLPKAEEQLVAELHRNHPDMKESEVKALLKPLIASKFKRSEAGLEKARRRSKSVTTLPVRKRICCAWRELLSSLGERKRTTPKEWMALVRAEIPQADSAVMKKVRYEVYEYHRLNRRAD